MKGPRLLPGLGFALALAIPATLLGRLVPLVGGPVFAIVLGIAVTLARPMPASFAPGVRYASRTVLQSAIVVLGTSLDVGRVVHVGAGSLPVMFGTMAICLAAAAALGRALGLVPSLRTLLGVGTAICGASAIAAVSTAETPRPVRTPRAMARTGAPRIGTNLPASVAARASPVEARSPGRSGRKRWTMKPRYVGEDASSKQTFLG